MSAAQPPKLDPIIHAPNRLRIVSTLNALGLGTSVTFGRLQQVLDLTSGNLLTHLRKLEDAGYVATETNRDQDGKSTTIQLTPAGAEAYKTYKAALLAML